MSLEKSREHYYFNSGKASDLVRQVGFAAIAVIWLFKIEINGSPRVPDALIAPLCLVVVALAADFLQYAVASAIWGIYLRSKEKEKIKRTREKQKIKVGSEFQAPACINWPALFFFWSKILCIVVAYFYLFSYLAVKILAL